MLRAGRRHRGLLHDGEVVLEEPPDEHGVLAGGTEPP